MNDSETYKNYETYKQRGLANITRLRAQLRGET